MRIAVGALVVVCLSMFALNAQHSHRDLIRVGIIGLDTPHVIAFTQILNDPNNLEHVSGARVVAGYKGGSPDIEESREGLAKYADELQEKWQVEIVDDIPTLCKTVDAILLESIDGRTHLAQMRPVIAARLPVFIDKPLAASHRDAWEIARLARDARVPWFSSSGLRFWPETQRVKAAALKDRVVGSNVFGPSPIEPHHPDLMWYGIHSVEMLYTIMGQGCESVSRTFAEGSDIVVGRWTGGRLGVVRTIRTGRMAYGLAMFGETSIVHSELEAFSYGPLVAEIVNFFRTHIPPVSPEETLEMFAFMEAADRSKLRDGAVVKLSEITGEN